MCVSGTVCMCKAGVQWKSQTKGGNTKEGGACRTCNGQRKTNLILGQRGPSTKKGVEKRKRKEKKRTRPPMDPSRFRHPGLFSFLHTSSYCISSFPFSYYLYQGSFWPPWRSFTKTLSWLKTLSQEFYFLKIHLFWIFSTISHIIIMISMNSQSYVVLGHVQDVVLSFVM